MKPRLRFTRFGTWFVLFTVGVGAAAINTGNNLLYLVLGIQLSLIIISGFLSDSSLWGLQIQWKPLADPVAGRPGRWMIEATKTWFPGILVRIDMEWSDGSRTSHPLPWVRRRDRSFTEATWTPRRRGALTPAQLRASTAFPFGLFEKYHIRVRPASERWIVLPKLERLPRSLWNPDDSLHSGNRPAPIRGDGSAPYRVRDFMPGDSLRHMSWKLSAKRGRWMVKEMEAEVHPSACLTVAGWPLGWSLERQEAFLSFIASVLWSAYKEEEPMALHTPETRFAAPNTWVELKHALEYLALFKWPDGIDPAPAADASALNALSLWEKYRGSLSPSR